MKKNTPPSSSSSGEEHSSSSEEDVPITQLAPSTDKPSAPPTQQVSSSEEEDSDVPITQPAPSTSKPTASAPTEKQVSSSEEEDSSSDEEEVVEEAKLKPPSSTPAPATTKPSITKQVSSDSSSEEDSSDEEEVVQDSKVKPPSSTPAPATTPKPTTTKPGGTKRPLEGSSREDAKRVKPDTTAEDTSKKPGSRFERIWSLDAELALLEGMICFRKDKGINPNEDTNAFFDSVKKIISLEEFSKDKVMEKIRSLKKKYTRKNKNGKDVVFTTSHDLKCCELAKSIWGVNGFCIESGKPNGLSRKNKKLESVNHDLFAGRNVEEVAGGDNNGLVSGGGEVEVSDWFDESFLVRGIAGYGLDERAVKQGWRLAPVEGKKRIKEEMKELRVKEFESVVLKSDIVKEAALMISEVLKHQDF